MRKIKDDVYAVGVIDWDRSLFDELIPLPDATSYNAYVIKGSEKTALLDTVEPSLADGLINNLVSGGVERLDYIVAHHGEQDHSGSIPDILLLYPEAKLVVNEKCKATLINLLHVDEERFLVVEDGQTLSLGNKTLQFWDLPWVHWPETFGTYLIEDRILFSCDFFGAHMAASNLFVDDESFVREAAKRYYAEIMMPFRMPIRKNLDKLQKLDIDMIAPSHGPIYQNPRFIMDAYADWISDQVKNEVLLPYVSMHGSTGRMVEYFTNALIDRDITVKRFNMVSTDIGKVAIALVDAATIVLGSPTVLTEAHPLMAYAAILANAMRPKTKFVSIIGSYGWSGSKTVKQLTGLIPHIKAEVIEPVLVQGLPKDGNYQALDVLADQILAKHQSLGICT